MMFWEQARLSSEFGHVVGMAFEANLAYSVLLNLGRSSGDAIDDWTEAEVVRVVSALFETKNFDAKAFEENVEKKKKEYKYIIGMVNKIAVPWAVGAAIVSILIQTWIGFYPYAEIYPIYLFLVGFLIFGSVPMGVLSNIVFHTFCRMGMRDQSKKYGEIIDMFEKAPAEELEKARRALKEQRDEARANQNGGANSRH